MTLSFKRLVCSGLLLAAAASLGGCGTKPSDFGITGPSPGQSLTPPPAPPANPDATAVLPGARTGVDLFSPGSFRGPATPGQFFGSD
jgi:hypothetical protein